MIPLLLLLMIAVGAVFRSAVKRVPAQIGGGANGVKPVVRDGTLSDVRYIAIAAIALPLASALLWFFRREIAALLIQPMLHLLAAIHGVADGCASSGEDSLVVYCRDAHQFERYHGRSVVTDVLLSAIVAGVVGIAGVLNYHLVYVPMHDVATNLGAAEVEVVTRELAIFLIVLEGFVGLLFFEFCGVTKLFGYVTNLSKITRGVLAFVMFAFLIVSAVLEGVLAVDRSYIATRETLSQSSTDANKDDLQKKRHQQEKVKPKKGHASSNAGRGVSPKVVSSSGAVRPPASFWDVVVRYIEVPFAALAPFALAVVAIPLEITFLVLPLLARFCVACVLLVSAFALRFLAWLIAMSGLCLMLTYRLLMFPAHCAARLIDGYRVWIG